MCVLFLFVGCKVWHPFFPLSLSLLVSFTSPRLCVCVCGGREIAWVHAVHPNSFFIRFTTQEFIFRTSTVLSDIEGLVVFVDNNNCVTTVRVLGVNERISAIRCDKASQSEWDYNLEFLLESYDA